MCSAEWREPRVERCQGYCLGPLGPESVSIMMGGGARRPGPPRSTGRCTPRNSPFGEAAPYKRHAERSTKSYPDNLSVLTGLTKRISSGLPRRCYSLKGGRSRGTRFSPQLIHTFGTTGPRRRYGRLVCGSQEQLQMGSTKRGPALRVSVGWISLTPGGPGFVVWTRRSGPS